MRLFASRFLAVLFTLVLLCTPGTTVYAQSEVLGIHLLSPSEISKASKLLTTQDNIPHYVTVPFGFSDLPKKDEWQRFFDEAQTAHLKPIIRLTTRFEGHSWVVPNRSDIMVFTAFLSALDWRQDELAVVLFNEPNHANEWGGHIDPKGYADIADFAADWLKTEPKKYVVLPAGLDLAASNGGETMEAFNYLKQSLAHNSSWLEKMDGWTSHSYPNPAFSSGPWKTDKASLRGYQHELTFLATYSSKQFPVYITETGWSQNQLSNREIRRYYAQAYKDIWNNDPRIKAVTPFLLQGAPGLFAPFSFLDKNGEPTIAYEAFRSILSDKQ
jgi:hypothetical protein